MEEGKHQVTGAALVDLGLRMKGSNYMVGRGGTDWWKGKIDLCTVLVSWTGGAAQGHIAAGRDGGKNTGQAMD